MARIIESGNGNRRVIKMSAEDIISIVKDYQRVVPRYSDENTAKCYLEDTVIYIPEEL